MLQIALTLALLGGLAFDLPVKAQDSTLQRYERQYISFFYPQDYPLNRQLANAFENDFPRFSYHLGASAIEMDLAAFFEQFKQYQAQRAGDLAAGRSSLDPRFGDKVVSWSETERIARSAWVFVPEWRFGEISIKGPQPTDTKDPDKEWTFSAESKVELDMGLYRLDGKTPQLYRTLSNSWVVSRDKVYRVAGSTVQRAVDQVNAGISESKDKINLKDSLSSSERDKILAALRREKEIDRALRQVESQVPEVYMMRRASESMGYGSVISEVRQLDAFLIRAEITQPDMKQDRIGIDLGNGESASTLGISKDASYKVMEYVRGGDPREVGYIKMREFNDQQAIAQPIIVGRDFELGDQIVEYPKAGIGFNLRGGILSFSSRQSSLLPTGDLVLGGGLDLDFNIGPALNMSELYLLFNGSFTTHYSLFEMGLQKKWYWRQLIFALGLRGGGSLIGDETWGGGGTALAGLHWQANPDFAFGLDGGWRQYIHFGGPVLEAFIRFDL